MISALAYKKSKIAFTFRNYLYLCKIILTKSVQTAHNTDNYKNTNMKRFFPSLLLFIMACCNAVMAQDADIIENLMFKPGGNTVTSFPAGTQLKLINWPEIGVNINPGLDATLYKQIGIEFRDNLESNDVQLWYEVNNSGTKITTTNLTSGAKDYQRNITGRSAGESITKIGFTYRTYNASTDLAVERMYLVANDNSVTEYKFFTVLKNSGGVAIYQYSGKVDFTRKWGEIDITDAELSPISYYTTDGEELTYKITLAEDLNDKIQFRLQTPLLTVSDGNGGYKQEKKDSPAYTILPSTSTDSENATTKKLVSDGEGGYVFEQTINTSDLSRWGNTIRVYISATGEKNIDPNDKDKRLYTIPITVNFKSITRRGREAVTINNIINDEGWTTYCNTKRLQYSRKDDMDAYIVTARDASNGVLTLQKVNIVPGNSDGEGVTTPVILKIPKMNGISSVTFGIPSTTLAADDVSANMLHAVTSDDGFTVTSDGNTYYALANKKYGVGFYKVRTGVTIPKRRAYLIVNNNNELSAHEFLSFDEGGSESTDITSIVTEVPTEGELAIYDLMGRQVQKTQRGHLYIKNGRKFIAK